MSTNRRAPKTVRHTIEMRVGTPVRIPSGAKEGVSFELAADGVCIGKLLITGAQISFRRKGKHWRTHSFHDVASLLG